MTNARHKLLNDFLANTRWADAERTFLAGDASNRSYERLTSTEHGTAVLMNAPPEKGEDTRPFINIADHLRSTGLSSPEIYEQDTKVGFLIIEDLGDTLFARLLERDAGKEEMIYLTATDALIAAQRAIPPAGLETYGAQEMANTALTAPDWYLRFARETQTDVRQTFHTYLVNLLETHLTEDHVLVQRDYHAENLLWLPERSGSARVGLLDFQDAMLGHAAYDLASLLKDARRDVSEAVQERCLSYFIKENGIDREAFEAAYATCSAQRNLRILGVFARLSIRDGKRHYTDMLPRVWRNLMDDFTHPCLRDFGAWVVDVFPEPTTEIIHRLKTQHV